MDLVGWSTLNFLKNHVWLPDEIWEKIYRYLLVANKRELSKQYNSLSAIIAKQYTDFLKIEIIFTESYMLFEPICARKIYRHARLKKRKFVDFECFLKQNAHCDCSLLCNSRPRIYDPLYLESKLTMLHHLLSILNIH